MSNFPNVIALPTQEIYKSTSTQRGGGRLGQLGMTEDGRVFRYCKNGAAALATSLAVQAPASNLQKALVVTTYTGAAGTKQLQVTVASVTANQYKGGYLYVEESTGLGYAYPIVRNTATDDPATGDILVELAIGIEVGIGSAAKVGLYNPYNLVVVHPSPATTKLVGVTNAVIPINYFFWAQIRGLCPVLTEGTIVINEGVVDSASVDGACTVSALGEATPNTGYGQNFMGITAAVGATGKTSLIDLMLG